MGNAATVTAGEREVGRLDRSLGADIIIANAPDPVFVSDLEGKILQANDAVSLLLGFRQDEVVEQSLSRFISPQETREFTAALREVVEKGVTRNARLNPRSASGEVIPTSLNASALRDSQGNVIGAIGILRDMRELDKALAYAKSLIKNAPDPVFVSDLQGKILQANDAVFSLLGFRPDELIEQSLLRFISPEETREFTAALREVVEKGVTRNARLNPRSASGEVIPTSLNASALRDLYGNVIGAIGVLRDMRELDKARAYAESLIKNAPDPVFVSDLEGKILQANDAVSQLLGFRQDEVVEQSLSRFISPQETREFTAALREVVEKGVTRNARLNPCSASGEVIPTTLNASALRDLNGQVIGAIGILRDMRELDKAKEIAEIANRAKSQFLANMSHELRTPLNAVILYTELLQDEATDQNLTGFLPDLQKIQGAAKHLLTLINDVLDLAKIESGKTDLLPETFDIVGLVQDVVTTIEPLAENNGNTLEVRCPRDLGVMFADMTKVRQSLFNLLSNACKFTEHGSICLDVARTTLDGRDWVTFQVTDSGIGISAEQKGRLFEPFSQADPSTTRKFGGTGLGLAITRRFCQMMGGDIDVSSVAGEGSVFRIKLPVEVAVTSDPATRIPAIEPSRRRGNTILVIDDDPAARDVLRNFLGAKGFRVETAADGEEGLTLARLVRPLVITLDVVMPRKNGWAVLSALKADPELSDIPIIMVTVVDEQNFGYTLGASDYLTKPINWNRFGSILKKYTGSAAPRRVLVIEDDAATRQMLGGMLEKEGWMVTEASNGHAALEQIDADRPALILLDLMMPGMNGFEFIAELRQREFGHDIPIVVLTAKDLTMEEHQRLHGNVERVLQKGVCSREQLLNEMNVLRTAADALV